MAQPFARTWGRMRGKAAQAPPEPAAGWTGDRTEWLRKLQRQLSLGRCRVRPGGPHDAYDLVVSIGPLVTCRLRTAIAWSWLPRQRTDFRPTRIALAVLTAGIALVPFELPVGLTVIALLLAGIALETSLLRRATMRALRSTTAGAQSNER
jgi:hypothetical protein